MRKLVSRQQRQLSALALSCSHQLRTLQSQQRNPITARRRHPRRPRRPNHDTEAPPGEEAGGELTGAGAAGNLGTGTISIDKQKEVLRVLADRLGDFVTSFDGPDEEARTRRRLAQNLATGLTMSLYAESNGALFVPMWLPGSQHSEDAIELEPEPQCEPSPAAMIHPNSPMWDVPMYPQEWFIYVVFRVPLYINDPDSRRRKGRPVNNDDVEVAARDGGAWPVDARKATLPSRPRGGGAAWVVSFSSAAKPFQVETSELSLRAFHQPEGIFRCDPGCQRFHAPKKCTQWARCGHCNVPWRWHAAMEDDMCTSPIPKCGNCFGPYPSGHRGCPCRPRLVDGLVVPPSQDQLKEYRQAGLKDFEAHCQSLGLSHHDQFVHTDRVE